MGSFDPFILRLREALKEIKAKRSFVEMESPPEDDPVWLNLPLREKSKNVNKIILKEDTFVELGNPVAGSCAFILPTDSVSLVRDGKITLIGQDIPKSKGGSLPFGQILIMAGPMIKDKHYWALEPTQFVSDRIDGYMIRTVPRKIWSRVSNEAAEKGFSFKLLGLSLMEIFKESFPMIQAMEVVFVTSAKDDVKRLDDLLTEVRDLVKQERTSRLMKESNCDGCPEQTTCDEIRKIIAIRKKMRAGARERSFSAQKYVSVSR